MVIRWTNKAKQDLINYKENSKIVTDGKVEEYIHSLVDYVDILNTSNKLGKFLFNRGNLEFRQLVYKMHKIFYVIDKNSIYILTIVHTKKKPIDINSFLKEYYN